MPALSQHPTTRRYRANPRGDLNFSCEFSCEFSREEREASLAFVNAI